MGGLNVGGIGRDEAVRIVVGKHYLHRPPPVTFAFGLYLDGKTVGVVTFGIPASRHLMLGACPSDPSCVVELNRLWCDDEMPRNTETWFLSRALAMMPPRIVVSYADSSVGHAGYVYRAANFYYAGMTDMDRKTPRFDYVPTPVVATDMFGSTVTVAHTRDAFRSGFSERRRRLPKARYWVVTGNRRERRELLAKSGWPRLSWKAVT